MDSEAKNIQINLLQSKGAVTVEDYWTECQYYDIVWVCFVFGNCNHCCFCCGHPFTMLGVSVFISCKNKIQCVCVCEGVWVCGCVWEWVGGRACAPCD